MRARSALAAAAALLCLAPSPAAATSPGDAAIAVAGGLGFALFGAWAAYYADDQGDYRGSGFYLQISGARAYNAFNVDTPSLAEAQILADALLPGSTAESVKTNADNSMGAGGRLGYRVLPYLAVEGQVDWVDQFQVNTKIFTDEGKIHLKSQTGVVTYTANVKGLLPAGSIQPYAIVGFGASTRTDGNDTSGVFRGGAGVDFWWTEQLGLHLETTYVLPFDDTDAGWVPLTFGVQWKFWSPGR